MTATSPIFFALGIGLCLVALGILLFSTMGMGKPELLCPGGGPESRTKLLS